MADKPLCCINCKKDAQTTFKSFNNGVLEEIGVCKECPWLLDQVPALKHQSPTSLNDEIEKQCPGCSMTLRELIMGEMLGCAQCFTTFADTITDQLIDCNQVYIPKGETITPHSIVHPTKGKVLGCLEKSKQLQSYREELSEALKNEDYERAATIRDEIKEYYKLSHE